MAECLTQRRRAAEVAKVRLGEVCDLFVDGDWIESKDQSPEGYRLVQTGNVGIGEYLDKKERAKFISAETFERLKCTEIFAGDVLVSRLPDPVGRACILPDIKQRAITAVDCSIIRFNSLACDARYFIHFTRSQDYAHQISQFLAGSTRVRISRRNLQTVELPLPPLAEQRRIAAKLDAICEIVDKRGGQLAKLDQLVKSRFVEMFGVGKWPTTTIGELSEFLTSGSRGWAKYYSDEGELFITIKNVKNSRITVDDVQHIVPPQGAEADRTRVRAGDLLISITADLGRTGVVTPELASRGAYINQHLTRISLKRDVVDPLYAAFYIESPEGKSQIERRNQSAVKAGLNFESIRSLQLPLPPIGEQREFAVFVAEVDKSKFAVQKSLESYQRLYRQQLQEAFG